MELFKLLGTIAINNSDANDAIDQTSGKAESFGKKLKSGIGTVAKFGAAFTGAAVAAGAAVVSFSSKIAATGDNIDKMSQKIGISRQAYQELDFICSQSGTSVDSLQIGIKTLTNQMQAAQSGTKSAVSAFEQLGVSIYDSSGNLKDQEAMMWEAMEALQSMENQTEKAALANDLFGKSGSELMPLLNGEAGSIEEMKKQAHELGLVMSDEFVDNSVKLTDTLDQAKRALKAAGTTIGGTLLPYVQKAIGKFVEFTPKISAFSAEISKKLSPFIENAIENVKEFASIVGEKFSPIIDAFKNLGGAIAEDAEGSTFLQDAFSAMFSTCSNLWNSIGQPVLDAMVSGINWLAENWEPISSSISSAFAVAFDVISTVWNSIGKPIWDMFAFAVSEIASLFSQNMPAIMAFFQDATAGMQDTWQNHLKPIFDAIGLALNNYIKPAFEFVFKTIIEPLVKNVFGAIAKLWTGTLKPIFDGICDFLLGVFTGDWKKALNGILSIVTGIFNAIVTSVETPMNLVRDIVNEAIDFIKEKFDFEWEFPKLKLPHFKIDGKFSLNPPSVPEFGVEWYSKGGIMNDPTMFGFNPISGKPMVGGEDKPEAIAPIDILQKYVADATERKNSEFVSALDSIFAKYTSVIVNALSLLAESGIITVDDPYRIFKLVKDEERKFQIATGLE